MMQAQMCFEQSVAFLEECSQQFEVSVQMVTTDRAGENSKCETGIHRLNPHFRKFHLPCDIHKTSTCISSMFKLTESAVTGIVNLGLMFRPGGTVQEMRKCISEEIRSKFKLVVGPAPGGYLSEYRQEVYELFLGKNFSNQDVKKKHQVLRIKQVQVLNFFLNGDIQNESEIVWYAPFNIAKEDAIELVCKYVPFALLPAAIAVFPRHRWHGCEIPIDQLGLLAAHHNLLKHACLRFFKHFPESGTTQVAQTAPAVKAASAWAAAAISFMPAPEESEDAPINQQQPLPLPVSNAEATDPQQQVSWEEFNRLIRAKVKHWVLQDEVLALPLLRFACSPIIGFMFACLKIAGEAWQTQEEHSQLLTGKRKYRVLEAFLGKDLENTFADLSRRLHLQIPALPLAAHTRRCCVLLFCMIARAASALHFLIRNVRSGLPYKLFACLEGRSSEVTQSPPCLHDSLTNAFMEVFGPGEHGLDGPEAVATLHVLAETALVDIAAVESRHATIRRALESGSVQTWRYTLEQLSGNFVCKQSYKQRQHVSERLFRTKPKEKVQRTKKRRGGGGAWRAFVRDQLKKQTPLMNMSTAFKAFSNDYRQLTPEQRSKYRDIGEAATLSHSKGFQAFGSSRPKKTRARVKKANASSVHSLEKTIAMKRTASLQMVAAENAKRQRRESDLISHCRKALGMSVENEPITVEEASERTLSITSIPVPSHVPKSFRIAPPNAALTKDWRGMLVSRVAAST
eukprot:Skav207827  [mRNA]  locus=scaffold367:4631:6853:- [translate_table: standard]